MSELPKPEPPKSDRPNRGDRGLLAEVTDLPPYKVSHNLLKADISKLADYPRLQFAVLPPDHPAAQKMLRDEAGALKEIYAADDDKRMDFLAGLELRRNDLKLDWERGVYLLGIMGTEVIGGGGVSVHDRPTLTADVREKIKPADLPVREALEHEVLEGQAAKLWGIYVRPRFRGKLDEKGTRASTQLLQGLVSYAGENLRAGDNGLGRTTILLRVGDAQRPARELYEDAGFRDIPGPFHLDPGDDDVSRGMVLRIPRRPRHEDRLLPVPTRAAPRR